MHEFPTAVPPSSTPTALRFQAPLDVLHEYACRALRRTPCQHGVYGTSQQEAKLAKTRSIPTLFERLCGK